MSDLPPADWYIDPEDDRQYRYWDGESWTEHRAPRRLDNKPRPTGKLIGDSVSMIRRRWRVYAVVIAVGAVVAAAVTELGYRAWISAVDTTLGGELDEIINRVTSPGFDPTAQESQDYFSSISFDPSIGTLGWVVLGLLLVVTASALGTAAVARAAVVDLRGRTPDPGDALRGGLGRLGRVVGVWLQILAAIVALGMVVVVAAFVSLLLAFPLGLAALALIVAAFPVMSMAVVTAAVGPKTPSLRYAYSLVKGTYWPAFGRLLVMALLAGAFGLAIGMAILAISPGNALDPIRGSLIANLVSYALNAAIGLVATIPSVLIYRDLGGDTPTDP